MNAKNKVKKHLLHSHSWSNFFSRIALSHKACFYTLHCKWILMTRTCTSWQLGTDSLDHTDSSHNIASYCILQKDQGVLKDIENLQREWQNKELNCDLINKIYNKNTTIKINKYNLFSKWHRKNLQNLLTPAYITVCKIQTVCKISALVLFNNRDIEWQCLLVCFCKFTFWLTVLSFLSSWLTGCSVSSDENEAFFSVSLNNSSSF